MATGTLRVKPGLVLDLPKATLEEKQKRKAAKATKAIQVAKASTNTEDAKVVLTIKGPPKNTRTIPKVLKPSMHGRQKTPKAKYL